MTDIYEGFQTDEIVIEAIESCFDGLIVDDSEARYVWVNGYTLDVPCKEVEKMLIEWIYKNYPQAIGKKLAWGCGSLTVKL